MKLLMAALCDRATIREGLLHILGAGVTQCSFDPPGAPDLDLALLLHAENWQEFAGRHSLKAIIADEGGTMMGSVELAWDAPADAAPEDTSRPQLPLVVPLRNIVITHEGDHHVSVQVDGNELSVVHFRVTKAHLPQVTMQIR